MSFNRVQQWATFSRTWWLYDAKWQCPFRSAIVIRDHLQNKHKPIYTQGTIGDIVVVINSRHIATYSDYWLRWKYFTHTGYPGPKGGEVVTPLWEVHDMDPTKVIWYTTYRSMKSTISRRRCMAGLHIFPDEDVPQDIMNNISDQIPQVMPVPKTLSEYSAEERAKVPRLFEYPAEHIVNDIVVKKKRKAKD